MMKLSITANKMKNITVSSLEESLEIVRAAYGEGGRLVSMTIAYPRKLNTRFTMKRAILITLLSVIVVVVGTISVLAYNNYRHDRDEKQAVTTAKANAVAAKQVAAQKAQAAELTKLQNQCTKDHILFVQTKGKSPNGDCDPSLVIAQ